jgi:hypothetical protein
VLGIYDLASNQRHPANSPVMLASEGRQTDRYTYEEATDILADNVHQERVVSHFR